jgi:predicted O-methyltransferase YrrM
MDYDIISQYTASFDEETNSIFARIEKDARERKIPIIQKNGLQFIEFLVRYHKPVSILEIGTAVGYSASKMAAAAPDARIVTMERDAQMAAEARHNIESLGFSSRIDVIQQDALEAKCEEWENTAGFDMIFIDAAKGQYRRFFEKYSPYLNETGLIISDNILFRGYAALWREMEDTRLANIARKVDAYNAWLKQQELYDTVFLTIGDGIALSQRKRGSSQS